MSLLKDYIWIHHNQALVEICQQIRQKNCVAVDTEFVRTRTYYPKLGLIQLFDGEHLVLIDPLMIDDFSPFIALLADQNVTKILHACGEDLDIFQHYFQQQPEPFFDTQIMAGFAGIGVSIGFAKLVQHYLDIELDKGASRTDWLKRPLSEIQLQYAAADVFYLLPIYHQLVTQLMGSQWQVAIMEECVQMSQRKQRFPEAENAYKSIKNAWQLTRQQLAVLQILAKWRLEEAQKQDLAVNFVIKEEHLLEIARQQPRHTAGLLEFLPANQVRHYGKKLIWLVEQGKAVLPEQYPDTVSRIIDEKGYKSTMKALQRALPDIQPSALSPELFASRRQLNQLFKWYRKGQDPHQLPELLMGWRAEYGKRLVEKVFLSS